MNKQIKSTPGRHIYSNQSTVRILQKIYVRVLYITFIIVIIDLITSTTKCFRGPKQISRASQTATVAA